MGRRGLGLLWVFVAALGALAAGCGTKELPLNRAQGKILIGGKPVDGLTVALIPEGTTPQAGVKAAALGTTGADGKFTLATPGRGEGVETGNYIITLGYADDEAADASHKRPKIDKKYTTFTKSTLHVKIDPVPAGQTYAIPTIELP